METKLKQIRKLIHIFRQEQGFSPNVVLLGAKDFYELKEAEKLFFNDNSGVAFMVFGLKITHVSKNNYLSVAFEIDEYM